jgi:Tol biopolymer transport system component
MKHKNICFHIVIPLILLLTACEQKAVPETSIPPTATIPAEETASSPTQAATATLYIPVDETANPDCNILWSRLQVGDLAYLTYGDRPNRVRSEPAKVPGNVIAQIYSGTLVTIMDGPVCADGLVFWKIGDDSIPGGSGWTAEGDGVNKHWLNPHHCASEQTALYTNHYALVAKGVQGLRVYDKQGSDGTQITKISANEMLKVVDGPFCTDNSPDMLVYWKVESQVIPGGSGWVAEYGFENDQFVRYLDYYKQADPTAFPIPPSLGNITPQAQTSGSLNLADLGNEGMIAFIQEDWAWVVDADGEGAYELKNPLGSYDTPHFLSWSPDGDYVTMALDKKLFLLSIDKDELVAREPVLDPQDFREITWSFDSEYIAFSSGSSIFAMKADGSDLHEISVEHEYCFSPTWSPYGIYLAYICWETGPNIYKSRVDKPGTGTFEAMGHIVAWSPDGVYLAYNDSEDGLSIVKAATGAHAQTLVPEGSDVFAWSPNSKSIAFLFQDQVYMVNIADKSIRNLTGHTVSTAFNMIDGTLSWSPDGKYITFEFQTYSFTTQYWRADPIYILDVTSGARAQLIEQGQGTLPAWSPVIVYPIVQLPDCTSGWSRLVAGEQARLIGALTDPPNRVRAGGSKSDEQTGVLYPGTIVDVLEGPVCADGLVFWKIRGTIYPANLNSTVVPPDIGWTAEGDGAEYYLEPYTP